MRSAHQPYPSPQPARCTRLAFCWSPPYVDSVRGTVAWPRRSRTQTQQTALGESDKRSRMIEETLHHRGTTLVRRLCLEPAEVSFAKNRSDRKPCSIRTLASEMCQVKGRVKVAADNHVTQRYLPLHPASRFSRTARYRCGNLGLSSRCVFGEPQLLELRRCLTLQVAFCQLPLYLRIELPC